MHFDFQGSVWACRHGHSHGNAARADAEQRGLLELDSETPDPQFGLTELGRRQADALGRAIAALPRTDQPTRIVSSPYLRALETAERVLRQMPNERIGFSIEARLQAKSFGVFERLTRKGEAMRFPHLVAQRQKVGRFHFCPPGGESRCDVVLRVRDFLDDWHQRGSDQRILIITHKVVMNALSYLLTPSADTAMSTNADGTVENAHLVSYEMPSSLPIETGLPGSPLQHEQPNFPARRLPNALRRVATTPPHVEESIPE